MAVITQFLLAEFHNAKLAFVHESLLSFDLFDKQKQLTKHP